MEKAKGRRCESAAFLHYYNFVCVVAIKRFCKQISKIIGKGARV